MNATSTRPRGMTGLGLVTLVIVAVLLWLGFWQLQRRSEKRALIAALTERLATPPSALPAPPTWGTLTPAADEFRRVTFSATYRSGPDAMVYSSGSGVRPDVPGPVTWAFLPAQLPTGETVVVNSGFVQNTMQDRGVQDGVVRALITGAPVTLTGYLRFPEAAGALTPRDDVNKRLWFNRDHAEMAKALGWGPVAPFYVDLEAPVPANGIPKPGPLDVHLKDDHMQYAVTWFGLAAAVLVAFGAWIRGERR
jgi:surfeit locus 1 family protein